MADGLRAGDPDSGALNEKQLNFDNVMECKAKNDNVIDLFGTNVSGRANFLRSLSEETGDKVENTLDNVTAVNERHHEGLLPVCDPEDCRKKRCVDRYDSSESSDSGVAVLSCTDCSGSSSSSDLTDPGSPFSSASSSHSSTADDHPPRMPPAQTAHHPPWPWSAKDGGEGGQLTEQNMNPGSPQRADQNRGSTIIANLESTRLSEIPTAGRHIRLLDRLPEKQLMAEVLQVKKNLAAGLLRSPNVTNLTSAQTKRSLQEKTSYAKRLKTSEKQSTLKRQTNRIIDNKFISEKTSILENKSLIDKKTILEKDIVVECSPNNNNNYKLNKNKMDKVNDQISKMQQGKITEYFKSQAKANGLKKGLLKGKPNKLTTLPISSVQIKAQPTMVKEPRTPSAKKPTEPKPRKYSPTVPRKILPAPSKTSEANLRINKNLAISSTLNGMNKNITLNNSINGLNKSITLNTPINGIHPNQISAIHPFTPTMTLTAVSFPSNLAYLPTKAAKPTDNVFVPQINLINHSPCLNIVQPVNNFNCTLNATVVPIVKLNTLPSRINGSNLTSLSGSVPLSVETAVPTVLSTKPNVAEGGSVVVPPAIAQVPKQYTTSSTIVNPPVEKCREEPYRTEECQMQHQIITDVEETSRVQKSPSVTDSDSGISSISSNLSTVSTKECLEVSIADAELIKVECQKSPILSQPKVIRFPPVKNPFRSKKDDKDSGRGSLQSNDGRCRWNECSSQFDASGVLLEHLQVKHVISQSQCNKEEQYVCLWRGCKVYGRKSCSVSWLERHVLAHAGTKPFRCIVDGCGLRFTTQLTLERHVNNHFNSDGSPNNTAKKSVENGSAKLFKRNGRIIRFRRQPWSARMFDFIDSGIMEGLQHKLLEITHAKALGQARTEGDIVHLQSQVIARRTESDGTANVLVRWKPSDVCPDEWIPEKEYKPTKTMPIPSLNQSSREALSLTLFPSKAAVRKHRRKPVKMTYDTT